MISGLARLEKITRLAQGSCKYGTDCVFRNRVETDIQNTCFSTWSGLVVEAQEPSVTSLIKCLTFEGGIRDRGDAGDLAGARFVDRNMIYFQRGTKSLFQCHSRIAVVNLRCNLG